MGRFVPIDITTNVLEKRAPTFTGAKAYYNGKECWQYKVVYDRPGSYTFTVPSGVSCVRTVVVGGGGKPVCTTTCCGFGGAGGAYSEKCMTATAGTNITVVVGRQSQDSSISCNGSAVHTAGGAVGKTPGSASGGDWNSTGGCAGYVCNYCGGSVSHYCGACICITTATCCGYCLVYAYNPTQHGDANGCCIAGYAGGGSAGSPRYICGGCAPAVCQSGDISHGSTAGGGGGIGSQCWPYVWHYACCNCICPNYDGNVGGHCPFWRTDYPTSASGGGGSHSAIPLHCRSWEGICQAAWHQGGAGGRGGCDISACDPQANHYQINQRCRYNDSYGSSCPHWHIKFNPKRSDPCRKEWWDISDISGAGAPGHVNETNYFWCCMPTQLSAFWGRPSHAGEGAGTGGWTHRCCNSNQFGDAYPVFPNSPADGINWNLVCCLGVMSDPFRCDSAYILKDRLWSGSLTCAGTLGGSGGVGVCYFNSKAGFGGGGGSAKCHIICICWGGSYDNCNGGATPLAFPPCILDNIVSNAGSGLAIIYYKEA